MLCRRPEELKQLLDAAELLKIFELWMKKLVPEQSHDQIVLQSLNFENYSDVLKYLHKSY